MTVIAVTMAIVAKMDAVSAPMRGKDQPVESLTYSQWIKASLVSDKLITLGPTSHLGVHPYCGMKRPNCGMDMLLKYKMGVVSTHGRQTVELFISSETHLTVPFRKRKLSFLPFRMSHQSSAAQVENGSCSSLRTVTMRQSLKKFYVRAAKGVLLQRYPVNAHTNWESPRTSITDFNK